MKINSNAAYLFHVKFCFCLNLFSINCTQETKARGRKLKHMHVSDESKTIESTNCAKNAKFILHESIEIIGHPRVVVSVSVECDFVLAVSHFLVTAFG